MSNDFSIFECVLVAHSFCSFDVHVTILVAVEALNIVSSKTTLRTAHAWYTLHEADHCLLAVRVKATVVPGVNIGHKKSLLVINWIGGQRWLSIVSKVCNKTLSVLQFNFQCLIIDSRPLSSDRLPAGALGIATVSCLGLIVIVKTNLDGVRTLEIEVVLGRDDLYAVGQIM